MQATHKRELGIAGMNAFACLFIDTLVQPRIFKIQVLIVATSTSRRSANLHERV